MRAFNKVTADINETETAADINEVETTNAQSVVEDEPFVSSDTIYSKWSYRSKHNQSSKQC